VEAEKTTVATVNMKVIDFFMAILSLAAVLQKNCQSLN
jgi:hypothetical protein